MADDNTELKFVDKRTAARYLRSGQIDDKAYERLIKSLPDVADKASTVSTVMGGDETSGADTRGSEGNTSLS